MKIRGICVSPKDDWDSRPYLRLAKGSDFHLKLFAAFDGLGEACHDLRNLLEVLEADDFDGRVHVAVRQADEAAGNAAACPEDRVGVGLSLIHI